ncbi:Hsp70 family protein [Micromonospora sp. NPDC050686]|uniref:Hsp70 family protein n=1 Tax=Micromonospora sp. NPDC050686 TaxID=3154631 RepID=UPI0033C81B3A
MRTGEARLAIDCGCTSTTAVVAWPDGRWMPLMFDGEPALPSAVLLAGDGNMLTGHQAWQAAATNPQRFIPAPRQSPEQQLTAAGTDIDALDLVAATLLRVAGEAQRVTGSVVEDVRLVVPAGWGPRRRTWMRHAAHRADLPQPRLIEAPIAVGGHLLTAGVQVPVGSFILVCDVGAGAEVSVLRRGPAGFEVLATLADPTAGGTAIDDALVATLTDNGPAGGDGQRWAMLASVGAAKHALADHAAVTVPLPQGSAVVLNTGVLEQAAHPVLHRVAQLTTEAIAAAEINASDLAGVYCVGGVARMPLLAQAIAGTATVTPTVVPDPATAAVRGAADAGAANPAAAAPPIDVPVPPIRRAVALAVPGLASLALLWQYLMTAEYHDGTRTFRGLYYSVNVNWGELTMACVFALLTCLSAGTILGSLIAAHSPTPDIRSEGGKVSVGILAAVSLGVAIAGLYAVVSSQYFALPVGGFLRWALWPITPIVLMAVAMALVAARQWRAPHGGWSALLAAPTGSVITAAAGMLLVQYSLTADRWPNMVLWIDLAGRVGGLLLGVGVVMALVTPLVFRLILGAPLALITAAIVSGRAAGVLGVFYAIAVGVWWAARFWARIVRPTPPTPAGQMSAAEGVVVPPGGGG